MALVSGLRLLLPRRHSAASSS